MKDVADVGEIIGDRFCLGRRRTQYAETVQSVQRRPRHSMLAYLCLRRAFARSICLRHDPPQHIHEQSRQREIRPGRIRGDMKENNETFATSLSSDQRRAVGKTRPGFVRKSCLWLGQDLTRHRHFGRSGKAEEGTALLKRRDVSWAFPRQCTPEKTSAATQ